MHIVDNDEDALFVNINTPCIINAGMAIAIVSSFTHFGNERQQNR
jgi:hypothetical protein